MRKFDDIICDFLREQGVPGASLCISLHGKPIYKQGYGISGCGELISSSSHFRIASISKILTAIAVLRLCEEGLLHLGQQVFGRNGILHRIKVTGQARMKQVKRIKVRDLLQHSSGWDRDAVGDHVFWYQKKEHLSKIDAWNNENLLTYILTQSLSFPAGTRHSYSNLGYLVLGLVIEEIAGIPYEHYVKTVFRDIGVEDIYIGRTKQHKVHFQEVKYFNNKDPPVEMSVFNVNEVVAPQYGSFPMENTGSYGGWVTCAQNLVTILDSLARMSDVPSVLTHQSFVEMIAAPRYATGDDWYGLGLDIEDKGTSFGHTGAMEGTSTTVHHNQNGLTWAFLLNSWAKDMDLDGLIKYALSSVQGLPLWNGIDFKCSYEEYFVMSEDELECVTILLPHKRLISDVMDMKDRGFRISWINALSVADDALFNVVWRKQSVDDKQWSIIIDVEIPDFNNCLKSMKENWEVIFLESYHLDGVVNHLFVFQEGDQSKQKVYVVDSMEEHKKFKNIYEHNNYQLQTQSVLVLKDLVIISAVYNQVTGKPRLTEIWLDLSMEDFVTKLANCIEGKLLLNYLQFYTTEDMPKISAVWHPTNVTNNVFQRHDVTKYGFLFELGESMKCNRPVSFISAYRYEDVTYFVAVWETDVRIGKRTPINREVLYCL
ncbi:uncharacterized protein LOC123551538 isoform X2 [Mercenaria mercenaria]|nr:uncharacterized protein LOC123551538 isoform X2 [Mercenaria mercenaria]XP_053397000.1 uncharacterized protein LOC123551538 isoform X2 [Mercenaria mercenaria]